MGKMAASFSEKDGKRYLQRLGRAVCSRLLQPIRNPYPIIDNLSSENEGVRYAMAAED